MKSMLFNFLFILFIVLILIIFYELIKPENSRPFNFIPFPNIEPKYLPDAQTASNCFTKLTPCDAQGKCSTCGEENYECINVDIDSSYTFNNIKVPKGQWCLPKKNNNKVCNLYTGRWTWVNDPDYCQTSNQCWKCICLYPELYENSENGCMTKLACYNTSLDPNVDQSKNYLVGTKYGPYEGKKWDPINSDDPVIRVNPYSVDKNGNPFFECSCNPGNNPDKPFIKLPNDPYSCHIDPCWKLNNYAYAGATCDTNTNDCKCECDKHGGYIIPDNDNLKLKNLCFLPESACGTGGTWNDDTNACNCPIGYNRKCKSNYANIVDTPTCNNPLNPVGEECINPCEPNPCKNNAKCEVRGQDYDCICPDIDPPWRYCKSGDKSNRCTDFKNCCCTCLASGTRIGSMDVDADGTPDYDWQYDTTQCCDATMDSSGSGGCPGQSCFYCK